jgi:hypothetical protein
MGSLVDLTGMRFGFLLVTVAGQIRHKAAVSVELCLSLWARGCRRGLRIDERRQAVVWSVRDACYGRTEATRHRHSESRARRTILLSG